MGLAVGGVLTGLLSIHAMSYGRSRDCCLEATAEEFDIVAVTMFGGWGLIGLGACRAANLF